VSAKPILPNAGSRVRLRTGDEDRLVDVAETSEATVILAVAGLPGGAATLVFSSPRGVVALTGELAPGEHRSTFTVQDQEWLEQRRQTFRLAVGCGMTVRRDDGTKIEGTVTDLSITGALLGEAAEDLRIDEHVEITIEARQFGDVKVSGTVVRLDGPRRAVHFDPLPANAQSLIERFLADEQRLRLQRRSG